MNRIVFKKCIDGNLKPGEWRLPTEKEREERPSVDIKIISRCPTCKLTRHTVTHTIADNGDVNPSVVCKGVIFDKYVEDEYPECPFHEWVTLEGWCK